MIYRVSSFLVFSLRVAVRQKSAWPCRITIPVVRSLPKIVQTRSLSTQDTDWKKMVDPKRVVRYEDVVKMVQEQEPEQMIIDVRNPDEVNDTGKIPSSINIPLGSVQQSLTMSDEEFQQQYHRNKPSADDELVFYCRSGRRSTEALDKALQLGFSNSKTYLGSWIDWSSKTGCNS